MKKIKLWFTAILACSLMAVATSCSKDSDDEPGGGMSGEGNYGTLGTNMVATGGVRAVSYTQGILLGTVDFSKLGDTHTFGVVYMEAVTVREGEKAYDYNLYLTYENSDAELARVTTTADGKFEKQLVDLKPGTTYYYRSYIKIGSTYNYAEVKSFTTLDPSSSINLVTGDAEDVCAITAMLMGRASIGTVNNGLDQSEISDQNYGFIYSDDAALSTAETLTMEYWEDWDNTHFDTQKKPDCPGTLLTRNNINSLLQELAGNLIPGTTYYYRTVFVWNNRYFYSPEVKSFTTLGEGTITVGTLRAEDIESTSAILKGHVPFDKIGASSVEGGFMISKRYSHRSEFVMNDNVVRWPSTADISYTDCTVDAVDFETPIYGLEPGTEYHVCAYIYLGRGKSTVDRYGNTVEGEKIYLYGDVISFTTEESNIGGGGGGDIAYSEEIDIVLGGWSQSSVAGQFQSTNAGINNSSCTMYIQVTPQHLGTLSFNWTVSSESSYDILTVTKANGKISTGTGGTQYLNVSGERSGVFSYDVMDYTPFTLCVTYSKDSSEHSGSDKATIRNISF